MYHLRLNIVLNDISINAYGPNEDEIYAFNEWYRANIRRGNTVVQVLSSHGKEIEAFIGRKGFEKFFDLRYEYIQHNLDSDTNLDIFSGKKANHHHELHKIIFDKARKAIEDNNKISIYKVIKANGENTQISWNKSLNGWLISSKNVSILARKVDDTNLYKEDRFHFAKLIAKMWFQLIEKVTKNGLLEGLKGTMNNRTFIGEYCGDQNYQHLVKYPYIDIHFFAIVDNNSTVTCIPPTEAFTIFRKYQLTHVKYIDVGVYDNWNELNQTLKAIYTDVAKASIDSEEEGSVIYMIKVDKDGHEETLSLSKLKTLEYRIYRKLREKLRNSIHQKGKQRSPWRDYYNKFREEVEDLCKETKPPMPLGYYFSIARASFEFAENYHKQASLIHDQYVTFLSVLMYCMGQGLKLSPSLFKEEEILEKAMKIPWKEYYKSYKVKEESQVEKMNVKVSDPGRHKVKVIAPIGISIMRDSRIIEALRSTAKERDYELSVLSNDDIIEECIEKVIKTNKKLAMDQVFEKSSKEASKIFNESLAEAVFESDKKNCENHVIFLDKDLLPNSYKGVIETITHNSPHLEVEIVALTPFFKNDLLCFESQGKVYKYPFPAEFFYEYLHRAQKGGESNNLPGNNLERLEIMIKLLNSFLDVAFDMESLMKFGFQKEMKIPVGYDKDTVLISSELKSALQQALGRLKSDNKLNNKKVVENLNEILEKTNLQYSNIISPVEEFSSL